MKICLISSQFPNLACGVADYVFQLTNSLPALVNDLQLFLITTADEKIKEFSGSQYSDKVIILPLIKRWGFFDTPLLLKTIEGISPDIIHIQYKWGMYNKKAMMTLFPLFLKLLRKEYPIVTTFHDLVGPYLFPKAGFLRRLCIRALVAFSDKVITTNKKDTENLARMDCGISGKISQIPTGPGIIMDNAGIKDIEIKNIRRGFKENEKDILISNFGFILPYKGIKDLLPAMKILIDKGYSLKLLVIGGFNVDLKVGSSYFSEVQKLGETLGLVSCIKWLGHCTPVQISTYLKASDICILPYTDGVSEIRTSFFSVLSHGLPIITTKSDNTPDKLVDNYNVLFVEPKSPVQLAAALEKLINSPELRIQLAKASRKLYEEAYSWDIIGRDTMKVYENIKE